MKSHFVVLAGALLVLASMSARGADLAAGKALFEQTCASCHGVDAKTSTDPSYPILAGQHEDYLVHAMNAYRRGQSGAPASANVRKNPIMGVFASQLSDQDIANVSAWMARQPSGLGVRR